MDGGSLPGRAHWANVVHQLLVLHETATTEVTGARVPLNRRLLWGSFYFKFFHQQYEQSTPFCASIASQPVEAEAQVA